MDPENRVEAEYIKPPPISLPRTHNTQQLPLFRALDKVSLSHQNTHEIKIKKRSTHAIKIIHTLVLIRILLATRNIAFSNRSTLDFPLHEVGTLLAGDSFCRGGFAFENGAVGIAGLAFEEGMACFGACEGEEGDDGDEGELHFGGWLR